MDEVPADPEPIALDPLRHQPELPPEERVLVVINGDERIVSASAARAAGYTIVDFRDEWTPIIFEPRLNENQEVILNRYSRTFVGLANDLTDGDGRPLPDDERNYLEVFGVPPSTGVLRDRFVQDADSACLKEIDYKKIGSLDALTYRNDRKDRHHRAKLRKYKRRIKKALKRAKVESLDALPSVSEDLQKAIDYIDAHEHELDVLSAIEARLTCEGHNHKRYRHKAGKLDHGLRLALRRFQRKHKLFEHTNLRGRTMELLAQSAQENNLLTLRRVMEERVVAATGILEDGSTPQTGKAVTFLNANGEKTEVRNLVKEFTDALMSQLGIDHVEGALAFFQRHPRSDFKWLKVGVKMPEKPEYYSEHMDLKLVIDRGTIWYDFPYTEDGKKRRQRRKKMPKVTLFTRYNGQEIPLVHWPTTIGGWRTELAKNGYVYLKYKESDVGDRVIRKVIAGPTWIAPTSTPLKSLAKRRYINGRRQGVINYKEMGPGHLSAYGLVAGYFVIPGRNGRADHDKGIRAHGSSDYMSIMSSRRFSHGCHRMMNHHAVRLYGFLLRHRPHTVEGEQLMNYNRQFLFKDEVYQLRVNSRGFKYQLDPPLPVSVLEGEIEGDAQEPLEGYFKQPGKKYPSLMPGEKPPEQDEPNDATVAPLGEKPGQGDLQ